MCVRERHMCEREGGVCVRDRSVCVREKQKDVCMRVYVCVCVFGQGWGGFVPRALHITEMGRRPPWQA